MTNNVKVIKVRAFDAKKAREYTAARHPSYVITDCVKEITVYRVRLRKKKK